MAAPPARPYQQEDTLRQELAAAVRSIGPARSLQGSRWVLARRPSSAFSSLTGPAILHHRDGVTAIYCAETHITGQAADALAALAARAMNLLQPGRRCQFNTTRVAHRQLPAVFHPALVRARGPEITAYVCARHITGSLAQAIGVLSAAVGYPGKRRAAADRLQAVWPPEAS